MCLVSFVPTSEGFVLSSNRDEATSRSTNSIKKEERERATIAYPIDSKGGTWCAVSETGVAAIILNGAFKIHKRHNNYRLSRGVMLKEIFDYESPQVFIRDFDFENIEPFTLIIWTGKKLLEFRWTGQLKHIEILDTDNHHVWSSSTLYDENMISERDLLFNRLISEVENKDAHSIEAVHLNGKVGNPDYDFVMSRGDRVCTVSFSQIIFTKNKIDLQYQSLLVNDKHNLSVA